MKALLSDFDETLYFKDIGFKQDDVESIRHFQKEGNLFGLSTGRPYAGMNNILAGIIRPDFYVLCSGALILDKAGRQLFSKAIDGDVCKRIVNAYIEYFIDQAIITVFSDNKIYISDPVALFMNQQMNDSLFLKVSDLLDSSKPVYGISIRANNESICKDLLLKLEPYQRSLHIIGYRNENSIDIVESSCSKATGIMRLMDLYHLEDDLIACIGDSYNDIPMLSAVRNSFTFYESDEEVQKNAKHLVHSIKEAIDILMDD